MNCIAWPGFSFQFASPHPFLPLLAHPAEPCAEWKVAGIEKFILPVIMGSVQQLPSVTFGDNTLATITLIARRSVQRAGVRHWRRGADAEASPFEVLKA